MSDDGREKIDYDARIAVSGELAATAPPPTGPAGGATSASGAAQLRFP
jgi:hypothetical protein